MGGKALPRGTKTGHNQAAMATLPRLRVHSLGSLAGLPPNAPPGRYGCADLLSTPCTAAYSTPPCLPESGPPFFALKVVGHSRR